MSGANTTVVHELLELRSVSINPQVAKVSAVFICHQDSVLSINGASDKTALLCFGNAHHVRNASVTRWVVPHHQPASLSVKEEVCSFTLEVLHRTTDEYDSLTSIKPLAGPLPTLFAASASAPAFIPIAPAPPPMPPAAAPPTYSPAV